MKVKSCEVDECVSFPVVVVVLFVGCVGSVFVKTWSAWWMYLGRCDPWCWCNASMWLISVAVVLAFDRSLRCRLCHAGSFGFVCGCICEIDDAWVKRSSDLTEEEKQRFIIADNVAFGEWDWDTLATVS